MSIFSQTKVEKLYKIKKYKKCIKLCDKNISENLNKKTSLLYKGLSLCENYANEDIIEMYTNPMYEAIKCVAMLEKYKDKKPDEKFYDNNKKRVKEIVDKAFAYAETLYFRGNSKSALNIYNKLRTIYPNEKIYFFKISKVLNFNRDLTLKHLKLSLRSYRSKMYVLIRNSKTYFKKDGKEELELALENLYKTKSKDLELISYFLVFLKKDYPSSTKINNLYENFQKRYWQIEMLKRVNDLRAKGCTCGTEKMKVQEPLVLNTCLNRTASKYARLMYKEGHFSHFGPSGESPWDRVKAEGCLADAENIAAGSNNAAGTFNQWKHSPGHCKNIMGSHKKMGVGKAGKYWVQMFY